jgi:hypothetical protein
MPAQGILRQISFCFELIIVSKVVHKLPRQRLEITQPSVHNNAALAVKS